MVDRKLFILGMAILGVGVLALIGSLLHIDVWRVLWPLLLIGLGVYVLLRPKLDDPALPSEFTFLGEIRRKGFWTVEPQEITTFVGDVSLDLTSATVPEGETTIKVSGFVTQVRLTAPEAIGIAVRINAFVADLDLFGLRQDRIGVSLEERSPNYGEAERRVRLEVAAFVANVKAQQHTL
jgi:predicted membrane protein